MYLNRRIWFVLLLALSFASCQGPEGIPGPAGPPGQPGPQTVALMYEVEFDLNAANDWEAFYTFPTADKIYREDVVLVYLLWEQVETDGEVVDVWRLMPVNYLSQDGTLAINFDFSVNDVRLFAEATFPLDAQIDVFEDLLARIVVVPADYSPNGKKGALINYQNYQQVKETFGLPEASTKSRKPFSQLLAARRNQKP